MTIIKAATRRSGILTIINEATVRSEIFLSSGASIPYVAEECYQFDHQTQEMGNQICEESSRELCSHPHNDLF